VTLKDCSRITSGLTEKLLLIFGGGGKCENTRGETSSGEYGQNSSSLFCIMVIITQYNVSMSMNINVSKCY